MNRIVLVTGATGNMGKAVISKFLSEEDVVIASLLPGEKFDMSGNERLPELKNIDLLDEKETASWISSIVETRGGIDIAVLTVGGFAAGNLEETGFSAIEKQIKLNFATAYNTVRPVFLHMKKKNKGRIFLVGARPGLDMASAGGMIGYGLSKSLIFRLGELLNHEAKSTDVVTSLLVPSTIDTPQNRAAMPGTDFNNWVKPENFADIIFYYSTQVAEGLREPVIKLYNKA